MQKITEGVKRFQKEVFPQRKALFDTLATGQSPDALFITCSDSRVDPCLITQTEPGDLFICRNAGNIVPPYNPERTGGMTASIEYAVAVLNVPHIIICGHTDCGAMKGAMNTGALEHLPHVKEWIGHSSAAVEKTKLHVGCGCNDHLPDENLRDVIEENVMLQIEHLSTHPSVAEKLKNGEIKLHAWLYEIDSGQMYCHNGEDKNFVTLGEHYL